MVTMSSNILLLKQQQIINRLERLIELVERLVVKIECADDSTRKPITKNDKEEDERK